MCPIKEEEPLRVVLGCGPGRGYAVAMAPRIGIVEFPTDAPERARRFWSEVLGIVFEERTAEEGLG